jgi:hypothetical protein
VSESGRLMSVSRVVAAAAALREVYEPKKRRAAYIALRPRSVARRLRRTAHAQSGRVHPRDLSLLQGFPSTRLAVAPAARAQVTAPGASGARGRLQSVRARMQLEQGDARAFARQSRQRSSERTSTADWAARGSPWACVTRMAGGTRLTP